MKNQSNKATLKWIYCRIKKFLPAIAAMALISAVTASSYVLSDNNKLDIRIEIAVCGFVFCEKEKSVITEIDIDKSRAKTIKTASLTVYFAECDESLWNIAEKYNTTVEAIMRENHLTGNTTEKKCKLLIPKV